MEKLCNINNVGIYIDSENPIWLKRTKELLNVQIDGFKEYFESVEETKQLFIKNIDELQTPDNSVIMPENSRYFPDGTFYSDECEIAFKKTDNGMIFWLKYETWYLPYILQFLLIDENKTFIHGAAVSVNEKDGILISAFGGIGKTCFIASAIKKDNIKLLGDDLIILNENGELTSYPRPFCIYPYHEVLFPNYFKDRIIKYTKLSKTTYLTRVFKKMKSILRIKDKANYNYITVSPIHLFDKGKVQTEPVKLKRAYMMRRMTGINEIKINEISNIEHAVNFTQNIIMHEYFLAMRFLFNRNANSFTPINDFVKKQYSIIEKNFSYADKIFIVDIPLDMKASDVSIHLSDILLEDS